MNRFHRWKYLRDSRCEGMDPRGMEFNSSNLSLQIWKWEFLKFSRVQGVECGSPSFWGVSREIFGKFRRSFFSSFFLYDSIEFKEFLNLYRNFSDLPRSRTPWKILRPSSPWWNIFKVFETFNNPRALKMSEISKNLRDLTISQDSNIFKPLLNNIRKHTRHI